MKKIVIVLSIAIITLTVMSCTQNKQQVASIQSTHPESKSGKVKGDNKKICDNQNKDSMAIGNICLNVTKEEFESQRNIFMRETPELGGLKIKSVNGLFYDDRLAAVQIVSQQQEYTKRGELQLMVGL